MVGPIYSMGPKLPHPPGGRCMPNRCYCRCCPSYVPLPATAPPAEPPTKRTTKK
jgi:hypothetical protein